MGPVVCLDCRRTLESKDDSFRCPACGGKTLPEGSITRATLLLPEDESLPEPVLKAMENSDNRLDKYVLVDEIGQGGMGKVYRAWNIPMGKYVALKLMTGLTGLQRERFHREARIASSLNHPCIVGVRDLGEHRNGQAVIQYLAMDLIDGAKPLSLSDLPLEGKIRALIGIAQALDYAHGKGIVHRDVKPDNILIDRQGNPYLTDFGIAKQIEAVTRPLTAVVGTPPYMAPEQAVGNTDEVTPACDIYSLGATLYHLAAGRPPFEGSSVIDILQKVVQEDPPPISGGPPEIDLICRKAMEKEPGRRYRSASAFAAELERYLRGESLSVRPLSRWRAAWKRARRQPSRLLVPVAVLAAGILTALAAGLVKGELERNRRTFELVRKAQQTLEQFDLASFAEERPVPRAMLEGALRNLDEAIALGPAPEALFEKGRALAFRNSFSEAEAALSEAIRLKPDPEFYYERAHVYLRLFEEVAVGLLGFAAASLSSKVQEELRDLSRDYQRRAVEDIRRAAEAPDLRAGRVEYFAAIRNVMEGGLLATEARILADEGKIAAEEKFQMAEMKIQAAISWARSALERADDPRLRAQLLELLGDAHRGLRGVEAAASAVSSYYQAAQLCRGRARLYYKAGLALLRSGKHISRSDAEKALSYFRRAQAIDSNLVAASFGLGLAWKELARHKQRLDRVEDLREETRQGIEALAPLAHGNGWDGRLARYQTAVLKLWRAEWEIQSGASPAALIAEAEEDLAELGRAMPEAPNLRAAMGLAHHLRARMEERGGRDPLPEYRRAREGYDAALAGGARDSRLVLDAARVHHRVGVLTKDFGEALRSFQAAVHYFERMLEEGAQPAEVDARLADACFRAALLPGVWRGDPEAAAQFLRKGIDSVDRAMAKDERPARHRLERGKMRAALAILPWETEGTIRVRELQLAISDFDEVLLAVPQWTAANLERARARFWLAKNAAIRKEVDEESLRKALEDYEVVSRQSEELAKLVQSEIEWIRARLREIP